MITEYIDSKAPTLDASVRMARHVIFAVVLSGSTCPLFLTEVQGRMLSFPALGASSEVERHLVFAVVSFEVTRPGFLFKDIVFTN